MPKKGVPTQGTPKEKGVQEVPGKGVSMQGCSEDTWEGGGQEMPVQWVLKMGVPWRCPGNEGSREGCPIGECPESARTGIVREARAQEMPRKRVLRKYPGRECWGRR